MKLFIRNHRLLLKVLFVIAFILAGVYVALVTVNMPKSHYYITTNFLENTPDKIIVYKYGKTHEYESDNEEFKRIYKMLYKCSEPKLIRLVVGDPLMQSKFGIGLEIVQEFKEKGIAISVIYSDNQLIDGNKLSKFNEVFYMFNNDITGIGEDPNSKGYALPIHILNPDEISYSYVFDNVYYPKDVEKHVKTKIS